MDSWTRLRLCSWCFMLVRIKKSPLSSEDLERGCFLRGEERHIEEFQLYHLRWGHGLWAASVQVEEAWFAQSEIFFVLCWFPVSSLLLCCFVPKRFSLLLYLHMRGTTFVFKWETSKLRWLLGGRWCQAAFQPCWLHNYFKVFHASLNYDSIQTTLWNFNLGRNLAITSKHQTHPR